MLYVTTFVFFSICSFPLHIILFKSFWDHIFKLFHFEIVFKVFLLTREYRFWKVKQSLIYKHSNKFPQNQKKTSVGSNVRLQKLFGHQEENK